MRMLVLVLVAGLTACASSDFIANDGRARAPLPEGCPMRMLSAPPATPYTELGMCSSKASGGGAFMDFSEKALVELKRCACEAGGNAVVIVDQGDTGFLGSQQRVRATGSVLWVEPQ